MPVKLHRNLALGIISGLEAIFIEQQPSKYVLSKLLKSDRRWGSRDRKLVAKAILDIIREKRRWAHSCGTTTQTTSDFWKWLGAWMLLSEIPLPDWTELSELEPEAIKQAYADCSKERKLHYSLPDWLDEKGLETFGATVWQKEVEAIHQPASLVLRINRLITTPEKLQKLLQQKHQIESVLLPEYPDALLLKKHQKLEQLSLYQEGYFEIQDANSQKVAPFVQAAPGQVVIDACAGGGGKSLHLAALMNNLGKLYCLDTGQQKLERLQERCKRNGVTLCELESPDNKKFFERMQDQADRVLIDAPCSGLGVLKRNPIAKWQMQPEKIKALEQLQLELLCKHAPLVKAGGALIYATCSIFPNENRAQIDRFLATPEGKTFTLDEDITLFSHQSGFDGFYMARLLNIAVNK